MIEWTFKKILKKESAVYLACNDKKAFFTSTDHREYKFRSCQNVCDALSYLFDYIYISFGTKSHKHIVGIPMGIKCAALVADFFLFCYARDPMTSLSDDNQANIIEAFSSTLSKDLLISKERPTKFIYLNCN